MIPKKIRTAVFPVAGRGTRFLPATKVSPKEMLPVVDKPLIQYAVEEALEAANNDDLNPMKNLLKVLEKPYENHKVISEYQSPAPPSDQKYQTFCGT